MSEGFSNPKEYTYVQSDFLSDMISHQGKRAFYTYYDFMEDGLPELLISEYYERTEGRNDSEYVILDVYGTDGETAQVLDGGYRKGYIRGYSFCENNILWLYWASGGMSAGGDIYIFSVTSGQRRG